MCRLGVTVVIAVLALGLVACGLKPEPTNPLQGTFPSHAVDGAGNVISLQRAPRRIVSLDPGASAVLRGIGLGDATQATTPAMFTQALADSSVEFVVVPLTTAPSTLQTIAAATDAPIFLYGADPLADAPILITQLGLAVGKGPQAAAVAGRVARGLDALARRIKLEGTVRTLIEGPGATVLGPASPLGQAVSAAGGENVFPVGGDLDLRDVSLLDVNAWVSAQPAGSSLATLQRYNELRRVPAIVAGRVLPAPAAGYPIDAALADALTALADDLHAPPMIIG